MTEFESKVLAYFDVFSKQLDELHASAQPARLTQLEARMRNHETNLGKMKGFAGTLGGVLTALQLAIDLFFKKHS